DVLVWRRDQPCGLELKPRSGWALQTRIFRRARYLLQRYVPICRRGTARQSEPGKGRDFHEHRAAHPKTLSGARAYGEKPARLANHPGRRESFGGELAFPASVRDLSRNCFTDTSVRGRELRAAGRIQILAVAGRCRRNR